MGGCAGRSKELNSPLTFSFSCSGSSGSLSVSSAPPCSVGRYGVFTACTSRTSSGLSPCTYCASGCASTACPLGSCEVGFIKGEYSSCRACTVGSCASQASALPLNAPSYKVWLSGSLNSLFNTLTGAASSMDSGDSCSLITSRLCLRLSPSSTVSSNILTFLRVFVFSFWAKRPLLRL